MSRAGRGRPGPAWPSPTPESWLRPQKKPVGLEISEFWQFDDIAKCDDFQLFVRTELSRVVILFLAR